jgi:hypothetical protein
MDKSALEPDTLETDEARRQFLAKCGRFALVTPPAMTMLLSVAVKPKEAHASTILGAGWNPPKHPLPKLPLPLPKLPKLPLP